MLQQTRPWILLVLFAPGAFGQWLNYPAPGTPRTRDGKADLSAKAPHASDGKPDLSGVWRTEPEHGRNSSTFDVPGDYPSTFSRYFGNILADFKNPAEIVRPEAAELIRKYRGTFKHPLYQCLPLGIPGADVFSYAPFKIIPLNEPREIVILYEVDNTHRQIYLDGRKLPEDPQPSWLGYSVGRWEGDTLVVDTAGFNDKGTIGGYPSTETLNLQERFHRLDFGHMDLQLTVNDPTLFLKPFTIKVTELLEPDSDVLEMICNENNTDLPHLPGGR